MRFERLIRWCRSAGWLLALGALMASLLSACGGNAPSGTTPPPKDDDTDMPACYPPVAPTSSKAISPEDQSYLSNKYHDLGILSDSAYEKLYTGEQDRSA